MKQTIKLITRLKSTLIQKKMMLNLLNKNTHSPVNPKKVVIAFRKAPSLAIVMYKRIREPATEHMIPRVAKTWVDRNQAEK